MLQGAKCSYVTSAAIKNCRRWSKTPITTFVTKNIDSSTSPSTSYPYLIIIHYSINNQLVDGWKGVNSKVNHCWFVGEFRATIWSVSARTTVKVEVPLHWAVYLPVKRPAWPTCSTGHVLTFRSATVSRHWPLSSPHLASESSNRKSFNHWLLPILLGFTWFCHYLRYLSRATLMLLSLTLSVLYL